MTITKSKFYWPFSPSFLLLFLLLTLPVTFSLPSLIPFASSGTVLQTNHLISISAHLDLRVLGSHCDAILASLQSANLTADTDWLEVHLLHFSSQCAFFHSAISSSRSKRQLGLVTVAVSSALGALGLESLFHHSDRSNVEITRHEIGSLSSQMDRLANVTKLLIHDYGNLDISMHQLLSREIIAEDLSSTALLLFRATSGLIQLFSGSLSVDLISPTSLLPAWHGVVDTARRLHGELPFSDLLNLYNLPVSHSFLHGVVTVFLPVPLVVRSLELVRPIPFPLLLHDNTTVFPMIPVPDSSFLAVDLVGQVTLPLTDSDLNRCISVGSTHFCSHLVSYPNPSCLSELYLGHLTNISSHCQLRHYSSPVAVHVSSSISALVSVHVSSLSYTMACSNGSVESFSLSPGHYSIPLDKSCSLSSQYFSIPAFSVSSQELIVRVASVSMNSSFFPLDTSDLPRLATLLQDYSQHARELHSYIRLHSSSSSFLPTTFDTFLLILTISLGLLFFLYLLYLYCQAKKVSLS